MSIKETIDSIVKGSEIVLFMKGTADFPQCGFSGQVVHILNECGAEFVAVNVLENPEMRQGIKEYSNWPTLPQLFVKGQLIGGCDIVSELYESGELQQILP